MVIVMVFSLGWGGGGTVRGAYCVVLVYVEYWIIVGMFSVVMTKVLGVPFITLWY